MIIAKTPPFSSLSPDAIDAPVWTELGGKQLFDKQVLPGWDPARTLDCSSSFTVDIESVLEEARISTGSEFAFVSSWWSPGTGLRGKGDQFSFRTGLNSPLEVTLRLIVPGDSLRSSVQLRTSLVLLAPKTGGTTDRLAAWQPGSILWQDHTDLVLEGTAPRFPITMTDFAENNLGDARTCWRLEWADRDLHAPAMGALRLWLNSQNVQFHKALVSTEPAPEDLIIRATLKFFVAQELLGVALEMAEDLDHGEFDHSSCGQVLKDLIDRTFPGQGAVEVRDLRKWDPASFSAGLQSRVGPFEPTTFDPFS